MEPVLERVRSKIPIASSVRKSPYCKDIIALRLGGMSYERVSQWLRTKGEAFFISPKTLEKTLKRAMIAAKVLARDYVSLVVEAQEKLGAKFTTDVVAELDNLVYLQKMRIEPILRDERSKQQTKPSYIDGRLNKEIRLLAQILLRMKEVQKEEVPQDNTEPLTEIMDSESLKFLEQAIVDGKLDVGNVPQLRVVK